MTAPVQNLFAANPGVPVGGLFANPADGGAMAGFEALLTALFGQAETPATLTPQPQGQAAPVVLAPTDQAVGDLLTAGPEAESEPDDILSADLQAPIETAFIPLPNLAVTAPPAPPVVQAEASPRQASTGAVHLNTPPSHLAAPDPDQAEAGETEPPQPKALESVQAPRTDTSAARPITPQATAPQAPSPVVSTAPAATPDLDAAILQAPLAAAQMPAAETPTQPAPVAVAPVMAPGPAPAPTPARASAKAERAKATMDSAETTAPRSDLSPRQAMASDDRAPVEAVAGEAETALPLPEPDAPDQPDIGPADTRAAAAPPTSEPAATPVRAGSETVATLAAQIVKKLEGRASRFDLELDPVGLGRVDVRIEIAAHGRVTAVMTFDNPQAAAELRGRAGELQRSLEQAGFDLSGGIAFDVAGDRGQARQEWGQQANDHPFRGRAFQAALDNAGEADQAAQAVSLQLSRGVTAGVDMRI